MVRPRTRFDMKKKKKRKRASPMPTKSPHKAVKRNKTCRLQILGGESRVRWRQIVNKHRRKAGMAAYPSSHRFDYILLTVVRQSSVVLSNERDVSDFCRLHRQWKNRHGVGPYLKLLQKHKLFSLGGADKIGFVNHIFAVTRETTQHKAPPESTGVPIAFPNHSGTVGGTALGETRYE